MLETRNKKPILYRKVHNSAWKFLKNSLQYKTPILLGTAVFFFLFKVTYHNYQLIMSSPIYTLGVAFLINSAFTIFQASLVLIYSSKNINSSSSFIKEQLFKNIHHLMLWALINIYMVIILIVLEAIIEVLSKYASSAISFAHLGWSLMGLYIIPKIVLENKSPLEALEHGYDRLDQNYRKPFALSTFNTKTVIYMLLIGALTFIVFRSLAVSVPLNYLYFSGTALFSVMVSVALAVRAVAQYELYSDTQK